MYAHAANNAPRHTAATDATTSSGRRRNFGGGAIARRRPRLAPAFGARRAGLASVHVTDIDHVSPTMILYRLSTWTSPMVITAVLVKFIGIVPDWPIPAHSTTQYEVARTV